MAHAYFGPDPNTGEADRGYAADGSGTSLAAPMVAGGLALMKQLFRGQLSHTELVTRLFATADKGGVYADSAVYGQGAMDVGAATSPVGVLEVPGASPARGGLRLTALGFRPGPALGDGMRRSLAGREIMALDELGAPFWRRLGNFTAAATAPPVAARLRRFLAAEPAGPVSAAGARGESGSGRETAPLSFTTARLGAPSEIRGSHLALAEGGVKATLAGRNGLSAAAFATDGQTGTRSAIGASLGWRRADWPVGLRAGWIGEQETLLGSVGEGAFGALAADTSFLGVDAARGSGWMAHRRQRGIRTGRPGGAGRARHAGIHPGHKRVRASRRKGAGRFRHAAPLRVPAAAGGARPGIVELAHRPDQAGRGVSQPGAGRPGAQRPAVGLRRAMAQAAGRGRASPGRRPEPPARPSPGHGPGVDVPRRLAPGVLTRGGAT